VTELLLFDGRLVTIKDSAMTYNGAVYLNARALLQSVFTYSGDNATFAFSFVDYSDDNTIQYAVGDAYPQSNSLFWTQNKLSWDYSGDIAQGYLGSNTSVNTDSAFALKSVFYLDMVNDSALFTLVESLNGQDGVDAWVAIAYDMATGMIANVGTEISYENVVLFGAATNYDLQLSPYYVGSSAPTIAPTMAPSDVPTVAPSVVPTMAPSVAPSVAPTMSPTMTPSVAPTVVPTAVPSVVPTMTPSVAPTVAPTLAPSDAPTVAPTLAPSAVPTITYSPSTSPTTATPTMTIAPTISPTVAPTVAPTLLPPTVVPTMAPSAIPTLTPSALPTVAPTRFPTVVFTPSPTVANVPTIVFSASQVRLLLNCCCWSLSHKPD
jgi:hypothetical protein